MTIELRVRCAVRDTARVAEALTQLGWGILWIDEPIQQETDDEGFVLREPARDAPAVVHAWATHADRPAAVPERVLDFAVEVIRDDGDAAIDWNEAWREGHPTRIEIVSGWVLVPPWGAPRNGERAIVIEPGAAFGTGSHPTTRDTLRVLHDVIRRGDRVLDLGAGSGVLAIAAVLWGAGEVRAVDIDESAPAQIAVNASRNGLATDRIDTRREDLAESLAEGAAWDVVLCNVGVAEVVRALPLADSAVRHGGTFVASGVYAPSRARVESAAPPHFKLIDAREEDRWVTLAWRPEVR
jgi:ribosomal protein L11 methyltransferase